MINRNKSNTTKKTTHAVPSRGKPTSTQKRAKVSQARTVRMQQEPKVSRTRIWFLLGLLPIMALLCNILLTALQNNSNQITGQISRVTSIPPMPEPSTRAAINHVTQSAKVSVPLMSDEIKALQPLAKQQSVNVADLFNLSVRTIVIDPGHGGKDPGASGPNGIKEKDITLKIAKKLKRTLEQKTNLRVLLTRSDDAKISLKDRAELAKRENADLFLSVHLNTLPQKDVSIVETFHFGAHADINSLAAAQRSNAVNASVGMGEFKSLLENMNNRLKLQESKRFAESVQDAVFGDLSQDNKTIRDAGIKSAPFLVLLANDAPAILAEVTCLSHEDEAQRLKIDAYQQRIANALANGVMNYLQQRSNNPVDSIQANSTY